MGTPDLSLPLSLVLQVVTLIVAAIGPFLAYRYTKKLALSSNRQQWLDALRDDVASFLSFSDHAAYLHSLMNAKKVDQLIQFDDSHNYFNEIINLSKASYRIRLRLRSGNEMHHDLIIKVEKLKKARVGEDRIALRDDVLKSSECLIQHVWQQIKNQ
ncbi:hypothetical protein [Sandaracinobacteroides saxicola]|uniref:Uncharacterized protein n=1 Tax=Sandaracinobacteroides saxicola TaxID=2759707 RepID=A0A7G5IHV7_9SPHN|nr:hypothetical protein [Sandaracinobacteroides saxicola]QMW22949.1 hypothetical protein H3309_00065 [Sandaracinobacteroides saxicola]